MSSASTPALPLQNLSRTNEQASPVWPGLLGLLLVFAVFWDTWARFPAMWDASREHGYGVAALCLWLGYRDRRVLLAGTRPEPMGLVALALLGLLWFLFAGVAIQAGQMLVVPLMLGAWLFAVNGRTAARRATPIIALFMLAVPVWEVLHWPLQQMTVSVNGVLFKLFRLQGAIVGDQIRTPWGTLEVAYECAGLNYLLAGLTIGAAYGLLFVKDRALRYRIFAVAAVLSIIGNWLRVFGLSLVANITQMKSPLIYKHGFYGWVIFAVFMALFFALANRMELKSGSGQQLISEPAVPLAAQGRPLSWPFWGAGVALAAMAPLLMLYLGMRAAPAVVEESATPGLVANTSWQPTTSEPPAVWQPGFTGAMSHSVSFWQRDSTAIRLDRYYYRSGSRSGKMVGYANQVAADSLVTAKRMVGPLDANARTVAEAVVRTGDSSFALVWYWYHVSGVTTAQSLRAKLLEFLSFMSNKTPAELIAVSVPCRGKTCEEASRMLYNFVTGKELPAR